MSALSEEDCYERLRSASVGRMGVVAEGGQIIHPVNYATDGRSIVVKVDVNSMLAVNGPMSQAAFEVDDIDEEQHEGWSVLLRGVCHDVTDAIDLTSENLRELDVSPWAPGEKSCWLKITPTEVTGRHVP